MDKRIFMKYLQDQRNHYKTIERVIRARIEANSVGSSELDYQLTGVESRIDTLDDIIHHYDIFVKNDTEEKGN